MSKRVSARVAEKGVGGSGVGFDPTGLGDAVLIDSGVLAAWLGLSLRTIECARSTGDVLLVPPHIKLGRSVRYRVGVVREWLADLEAMQADAFSGKWVARMPALAA